MRWSWRSTRAPLRATSRARVSLSQWASAAVAVTKAGLWPRKVPLCSPGAHWSNSGFISTSASGRP